MTPDLAGLTVLLVEDNPGDARLIRAMLSEVSRAPELVHVDRLTAARERLLRPGIDVVLLDLGLPDSHGLETYVQIRAMAPQLPIVVLSGQTDATLALRAVQEGAQDCLLKGHVDPEVLVRALRYAVEHKQIVERERFLSDVSRALSGTLDYEATMELVVQAPVPRLGDACILSLPAEGRLPRLIVHDADAARAARLQEENDWFGAEPTGPQPGLPAHLESLGLGSFLASSLAAHGHSLGTVWLLRSEERPAFTRQDSDLLESFAIRSALALDNARLHRELQGAIRLRDEVLAATSHDLRSPLAGIKQQNVLLRRLLRAHPSAADADLHRRVADGLDQIDATIGYSLQLIEELLDAAALQAGRRLELNRRPTDLVALATRIVAEQQARTDYHRLELQAPERSLVGEWDPTRLGRVLDNLLSNAVKYSRQRDTITVALAVEWQTECEWAVMRVQDHGAGIPATELAHVFDRFYRGSNVASDKPGVGIGLSGVREIVELHGGWVSVDSEEGRGSTFTVRLPITRHH